MMSMERGQLRVVGLRYPFLVAVESVRMGLTCDVVPGEGLAKALRLVRHSKFSLRRRVLRVLAPDVNVSMFPQMW